MKNKKILISTILLMLLMTGCGEKPKQQAEITEVTTIETTEETQPVIIANNKQLEKEDAKETSLPVEITDTEQSEQSEQQETEKSKILHKQPSVIIDNSEKSIHFGIEKNTDFDISIINICGADVDISDLKYETLIKNADLKRGKEIEMYDIIKEDEDFNFTAYAYGRNFYTDADKENDERLNMTDIEGNQLLFNGVGNIINLVTEKDGVINPDSPENINTFILNRIWNTFPENIAVEDDVPVKILGKIDWQKPVSFKSISKILGDGIEHNGYICYNDGTTTMLIEKISQNSDFVRRIYFYENSTINAK